MPIKPKPVSDKSKKNDIFDAYQDLLKQIEGESKAELPMQTEVKIQEQKVLEKTSNYSSSKVEQEIAKFQENLSYGITDLVKKISQSFKETEGGLRQELEMLAEVRQAIKIEQINLKEVYGLKDASLSLTKFLQAIEDEKKRWEEEKAERQKGWSRESEEYQYSRDQSRKKEEDEYKEKQKAQKLEFETKLLEKKQAVESKEVELNQQLVELKELRQYREKSEAEKSKAIKTALEDQAKVLKKDYDTQFALEEQKNLAEQNLLKQELKSVKDLISAKDKMLAELKKEAEAANQKAQDLALQVIQASKKEVKVVSGEREERD